MPRFFQIAISRHIVINAGKVVLVIGVLLNLVNQQQVWQHDAAVSWMQLLLKPVVPLSPVR